MTVLIESYKDENTITTYIGHTLDNITQISLSPTRESLRLFSHLQYVATINLKLLKRLEITED